MAKLILGASKAQMVSILKSNLSHVTIVKEDLDLGSTKAGILSSSNRVNIKPVSLDSKTYMYEYNGKVINGNELVFPIAINVPAKYLLFLKNISGSNYRLEAQKDISVPANTSRDTAQIVTKIEITVKGDGEA